MEQIHCDIDPRGTIGRTMMVMVPVVEMVMVRVKRRTQRGREGSA
jgi:hypothetical protein